MVKNYMLWSQTDLSSNACSKSDDCQMRAGLGEKVKNLRSTNWLLQKSHEDVKYSTGNTVNSIIITMYGTRWPLNLLGGITS